MSNTTIQVDVAIIGAGSAGMVARRQALTRGAERVVMIEGGPYGTTCARVGCMPSKLLIAAADVAHECRRAEQFGIEAGELRVDGEAVMARVRRERDRFAGSVINSVERIPDEQLLRGWARFEAPGVLLVEAGEGGASTRVEAKAVVIASGSTPNIPPPLRGLDEDRLLTSDTIFELPTLPRSLAVVGVGVIGLELGQALARLGVETRMFDIATRLPLLQSETMQAAGEAIFREELSLELGAQALEAEAVEGGVKLRWTDRGGEAHEAVFEKLLAATGRRPQLARLQLDKAGVELDERGVPKSWDERTTQIAEHPIFLAGDITGTRPLLHEAAAEGRIAGINAARYPEVRAHVRYVPLGIMFSDPNVAVVGEVPEASCEDSDWYCGEVDYSKQGRARVVGRDRGKVRIYARRRCGKLIGAEMIGPGVEHMAHLLAWAIEQGMTASRALEMPYYHPVFEEGLRTAIHQVARKLKMASQPRPLDCGPGT